MIMELVRFMFESGWHYFGVLIFTVIVLVCLDSCLGNFRRD